MPTFDAGSITSDLTLNDQGWNAALTRAKNVAAQFTAQTKNQFAGIQAAWDKHASSLRAVGLEMSLAGAAASAAIGYAVKAAAKVQESENLVSVVFGKQADAVRAWSDSVAESLGHPATELREITGNFDSLFTTMGFGDEAALKMSKNITKLAADLESFRNIPFELATEKIMSAIAGEIEPLRKYGVDVRDAATDQFAWKNGIAAVGQELDQGQKSLARYGIVMKSLATAQGDFVNTQNSLTNAARTVSNQVLEMSQRFGALLIPSLSSAAVALRGVDKIAIEWIKNNQDVATTLAKVGIAVTGVTVALGGLTFMLPGIAVAFKGVTAAASLTWAVVASGPGIALAAVAGVAAGIYTLRAVWDQNLAGMRDKLGTFESAAGKALDLANYGLMGKQGWKDFGEGAKGTVNSILQTIVQVKNGLAAIPSDYLTKPVNETLDRIGDAMRSTPRNDYIAAWTGQTTKAVAGAADAVAKATEDAAPKVMKAVIDQATQDLDAVIGKLKEKFPDAAAQVEKLKAMISGGGDAKAEPYTPFNADELMKGMKSSIDGSKKAAHELEQLKEKAKDLAKSVLPAAALTDSMKELALLAGKFPQYVTSAVKDVAMEKAVKEVFDAIGSDATKTAESVIQSAGGIADSVKAKLLQDADTIRSQQAEAWAKTLGPGADVVAKVRENIVNLMKSAKVDPRKMTEFAKDIASSFGSMTQQDIQETTARLVAMGIETEKLGGAFKGSSGFVQALIANIAKVRQAAKVDESFNVGKQILAQIQGPDIAKQFDAAQLAMDRMHFSADDRKWANTILAKDFWSQLQGLSLTAINKRIADLRAVNDDAAKAQAAAVEAWRDGARKSWALVGSEAAKANGQVFTPLQGMKMDVDAVGGAFGNLGQEIARVAGENSKLAKTFKEVAQAAKVASDVSMLMESWGNPISAAVNGLQLAADAMGLFGSKTAEVKTGMSKVMEEINKKWSDWADKLTDTLVKFVETGKLSFHDLANSIMEDILKITIRWAIVQPIMDAVGIHTTANAKGNVFEQGQVSPFAKGTIISTPTLFPMAKGIGLMGEAGPEAIMPLKRGADGKLGVAAQGGGVVVNIHDNRTGASAPVDVVSSIGPDGLRQLDVYIDNRVRSGFAQGNYDSSLSLNYGAKRVPLRR